MRIEAHFEPGGFWALRPEWNNLVQRSYHNNLFLTWEWQSTWWKHLGEGSLLLLGFRADNDGRLVGIAPLFHTVTDTGETVLRLVGCRDISDYLDLIVEAGHETAVYQALLDYLEGKAQGWDLADLCNIPQASQTLVTLREMAEARGYQTLVEVEDVCPIITLPQTWDDYLYMLDKKQRHEVRRKLRKAEREADARFFIVGPDRTCRLKCSTSSTSTNRARPTRTSSWTRSCRPSSSRLLRFCRHRVGCSWRSSRWMVKGRPPCSTLITETASWYTTRDTILSSSDSSVPALSSLHAASNTQYH